MIYKEINLLIFGCLIFIQTSALCQQNEITKSLMGNESYMSQYDSINYQKVSSILIDGIELDLVKELGVPKKYTFVSSYDPKNQFEFDELFLPFSCDVFNEMELFNILENNTNLNWRRIVLNLKLFSLPKLKNRERLLSVVSKNLGKFQEFETMSIISSNLFIEDKLFIRQKIEDLLNDKTEILKRKEKNKLIDQLLFRYVQNNIDEFSIVVLNYLISEYNAGNHRFYSINHYDNPIDYLLYFEQNVTLNSLVYIFENSNDQRRKVIQNSLVENNSLKFASYYDFTELTNLEFRAAKLGIENFEISIFNKMFLMDSENNYNAGVPKLKFFNYSNYGIQYSGLSEIIKPQIAVYSYILRERTNGQVRSFKILNLNAIDYLLIESNGGELYGFKLIEELGFNNSSLALHNLFNFVLMKSGSENRFVHLRYGSHEGLMCASPFTLKKLVENMKIELFWERELVKGDNKRG